MVQNLREFESILEMYTDEERDLVMRAARTSDKLHKGQLRDSGEPYIIHPLQVAEILIELKMDPSAVVAALLHDVLEDTDMTRVDLRREYGKEVEALVNGVTKIAIVKAKNKNVQQSETIRKMLLAMVKDVRVILIKLADKLHNMRTLDYKNDTARKREIAQECIDIYAPLAHRLGISWIKAELEDLALKQLNAEVYNQIKGFVATKRREREQYLLRVENALYEAARAENIEVEVEARAKHFYSIYEKMKQKGRPLHEIFDFLGVRVLCSSANDCYTLLGLVHRIWPPIEGRFKDYVAMPKSNRYQSLHTTVLCYEGKTIEIQIRTFEMHRTAEYGIAAHWLYKRNPGESDRRAELRILNQVRTLNTTRITSNEFLDEIKRELLKDSIYVFTPKGDAVELPKGSTAIDFAYHIHTEIGNRTVGAKADGSIIPLKEELKNTQVIEIITSPSAHPHLAWLRSVRTRSARSKIRNWLNKHDDNLIIDRSIVARRKTDTTPPTTAKKKPPESTVMDKGKVGVRVGDERNMMIRFANCCHPVTGDDITGYISRGRGIIVHRRNCPNLRFIEDFDERHIEVEWETVSPRATVRLRVSARKTFDLFSEIEGAVKKYHGHLIEGKVDELETGRFEALFTLELDRRDDAKKIMKSIRAIPAVMNVAEVGQPTADLIEAG